MDDFLKLRRRFAALMSGKIGFKIGFSSHLYGIQVGPVVIVKRRQPQFVG
jgi:hypothetical protein